MVIAVVAAVPLAKAVAVAGAVVAVAVHLLLLFLFLLLPHLCCRSDACCPLLICQKHCCFSADVLSREGCGLQQIFCARARRSTVDVSLDHLSALCIAPLWLLWCLHDTLFVRNLLLACLVHRRCRSIKLFATMRCLGTSCLPSS